MNEFEVAAMFWGFLVGLIIGVWIGQWNAVKNLLKKLKEMTEDGQILGVIEGETGHKPQDKYSQKDP